MAVEYVEHRRRHWRQMYGTKISNHQYDLRAASLLHFLHKHTRWHGAVLRFTSHYQHNAGNWTVYVRAFLCLEECALFVNAIFEHEWKKIPKQLSVLKELSKVLYLPLCVWNCSIHSTPVKSYATHVKAQSLTHFNEYKYSITHILTNHQRAHTCIHTRSLETALTCAMCDRTWFYFRLFSAVFLLLLLVLLLFCIDFEILLYAILLFLELLFSLCVSMLSFVFFPAIKFSIRFLVVVCLFIFSFVCLVCCSFTHTRTKYESELQCDTMYVRSTLTVVVHG